MKIFEVTQTQIKNPVPYDDKIVAEVLNRGHDLEYELRTEYFKERGLDPRKNLADSYTAAMKEIYKSIGDIQNVPLDKVIAGERTLFTHQLAALRAGTANSSSDIPIIYKLKNNYVVADGNHRVAIEYLDNATHIRALVVDLNNIPIV